MSKISNGNTEPQNYIDKHKKKKLRNQVQTKVLQIGCGKAHTLFLLEGGFVCSCGLNEDGQLGFGDADERIMPNIIPTLSKLGIDFICAGSESSFAYSEKEKTVYSWGWGDFGVLGCGELEDQFVPRPIAGLQGRSVRQMSCGDSHTLVVLKDGSLYSFGRNVSGQLGLGHLEDQKQPVLVKELTGVKIIQASCGAEHNLVISEDGRCFAFGWGRAGNLGCGDQDESDYTRSYPTQILQGDIKVIDIACGWRHSILLSDKRQVYTFGWNQYGQLGTGDSRIRNVPTLVESLKDKKIVCIGGGWRHTLCVSDDSQVFATGWNMFGQLGLGHREDAFIFQVNNQLRNEKVQSIYCGWRHSYLYTETKNIYSCGRGNYGQLALGNLNDKNSPTLVKSLSPPLLDGDNLILDVSTSQQTQSQLPSYQRLGLVPQIQSYNAIPDNIAIQVEIRDPKRLKFNFNQDQYGIQQFRLSDTQYNQAAQQEFEDALLQ